jgi:chaperonin cofactor prefoldin
MDKELKEEITKQLESLGKRIERLENQIASKADMSEIQTAMDRKLREMWASSLQVGRRRVL